MVRDRRDSIESILISSISNTTFTQTKKKAADNSFFLLSAALSVLVSCCSGIFLRKRYSAVLYLLLKLLTGSDDILEACVGCIEIASIDDS